MKDGRDRREQHQQKDGEACDIGFDDTHVERKARRRFWVLQGVLGARKRLPKGAQDKAPPQCLSPRGGPNFRAPSADPEAPCLVEPPQTFDLSPRARPATPLRPRRVAPRRPLSPPGRSEPKLSLGLRKVYRQVVNHDDRARSWRRGANPTARRRWSTRDSIRRFAATLPPRRAAPLASPRRVPAIGRGQGCL